MGVAGFNRRAASVIEEVWPALTVETAEGEIRKYWTLIEIDGLRIEKGSKIIQAYFLPPYSEAVW